MPTSTSFPVWLRKQLVNEVRRSRLKAAIMDRGKTWVAERPRRHPPQQQFLDDALDLLQAASDALERDEVNAAWAFVLTAERAAVAADAAEEERLRAHATKLREEVQEKLSGWRKMSALRILGDHGTPASVEALQEAMRIRDEHSHNQYHKLDLLARQLTTLGALLFAALAALLIAAHAGMPPLEEHAWALTWAALLGGSGALLSATRSVTRRTGRKIPEHLGSWPITLVRPLLGGTAGVAAWLIVRTGVVTLTATEASLAPLVAAFVAGFSERYFLSLVPGAES